MDIIVRGPTGTFGP